MSLNFDLLRDTLAVIVVYEMDPAMSPTVRSLEKAVAHQGGAMCLLLYDNSLQAHTRPVSGQLDVHYEHDPSNGGVSKAYNRGFALAKELGKKWLLLLDQDDEFGADALSQYQQSVTEYPSENVFVPIIYSKAAIVSPFRIRFGGGWRIQSILPGLHLLQQYLFINTGLFITLAAFENAGGYEPAFPLDFSDLDFVHRLRMTTKSFVVVNSSVQHSFAITAPMPTEKRVARFITYLNASRLFRNKYPRAIPSIFFRSFLMALRLSLRHRSAQFMAAFLNFSIR